MPNVVRYVVVLGIICVMMGLGIGLSYQLMKERIEQKELDVTLAALEEVLPGNVKRPWATLDERSPQDPEAVFVGVGDRGETIGYAAIGEHQGYSSKVRVMVGVEPGLDDLERVSVKAVAVLSQQETPGLGTGVEERRSSRSIWDVITFSKERETFTRPFLDQFPDKTYNKLQVIKTDDGSGGIVAVTAATISSTAVVEAARKAVVKIRNSVQGQPPAETEGEARAGASGK